MPDFQAMIQDNRKERERLLALMAGLKDGDFNRRLPKGWTITVALAHLAFWDLSQVARLKRWLEQGIQPVSIDAEAVNGPLAMLSEALPPQAVMKLAKTAAEAIDKLVESLTQAQVEELLKMGLERNIHRALHRRDHLEKIEKVLKG